MIKKNIACLVFLSLSFSLLALSGIDTAKADVGFEAQHETVFLNKNTNEYRPDTLLNTAGSVFCSVELAAGNHNFLVQPGIIIKEKKLMPFFRKLRYSLFTDRFSFSVGKSVFSFGEGIMKNYFFVHILQPAEKMTYPAVWHTVFEFPVRQFLFTAGMFFDADSTAQWKVPKWYSFWIKAVYSDPVLSIGLESDVLLQPELKGNVSDSTQMGMMLLPQQTADFDIQKKASIFTTAAEMSVLLPYQCKLYAQAQLPVDVLHGKITDWGVLGGISKDFILRSITLSSVAESSYSQEGFGYSVFQSMGITEWTQISAGIQGVETKNLIGLVQSEFFISTFKIKVSYITKNLIEKEKTDMNAIGIFSIAVHLNGDL